MSDSFEDLSARARRGLLSGPERRRLGVLLRSSAEARLWHTAGRELDAEGSVAAGDHDAAERVMQRLLGAGAGRVGREQKPRRVGRWRVVLIAIASVLVVSGALAAIEAARLLRASSAVSESRATPPAAAVPKTPSPSHSVAAVVEMAPPALTPTPAASALVEAVPAPSAAVTRDPTDATAAELFRSAALARRQGSPVQAIALLDSLQARHPKSREAHQADMTLGALHLQRGAPAAAFEHFQRYSRSSSQGELALEALWGEYQALSALGRRAEAAARLQRISEQYPGSPYAASAHRKLANEPRKP